MNNDRKNPTQQRKVEIDKCKSILHARLSALLSQCDALSKAANTEHEDVILMSGELVRVIATSVDYAAMQLANAIKREAGNE